IDASGCLLVDDLCQRRLAEPVEFRLIDCLAAAAPDVEPRQLRRPRQAAGVGRQDALGAPLHVRLPVQRGNCSSRVSRPRNTAIRLRTANPVMIAVACVRPPSCTTSRPATSGPKLVTMRPEPLQNATAVERTCVGNSS